MDRRGVAQRLGEGTVDEGAVPPHGSELLGVGQQVGEDRGDGLVGRLAARGEQQAAERLDVLVAHPYAVDLGGAQRGEQVVPGLLPAPLDHRDHVLGELLAGALPGRHDRGVARQVAEERDDVGVPAVEALVVRPVQAQHVGDDQDGEARRERLDEVGLPGVPEGVDELAGVALDDGQELLLEVRPAEGRSDQGPAHRVFPAAELEDGPAVDGLQLPVVVLGGELLGPVLEDALDVLVPGDEIASRGLVVDQGGTLAHRPVGPVGIGGEGGRENVGR